MPKRTIRNKTAPPPLEVWVRGLDELDGGDIPDVEVRFAKLSRALVVLLVEEQQRQNLSVAKMASRLGVEESKYRKDRQRVSETPAWAPDMHVTTLANIVNEETWPTRIRETAVILARRKTYAARQGIAVATTDIAAVSAVFGAFANTLFSAAELPSWIKDIDARDISSWRAEMGSQSAAPRGKAVTPATYRQHTPTEPSVQVAAPRERALSDRTEEHKFSPWAQRLRIAQ